MAIHTEIKPVGLHQWEIRQRLWPKQKVQTEQYDVEGHEDEELDEGAWSIQGRIDLRSDTNPTGPLVELVGIDG